MSLNGAIISSAHQLKNRPRIPTPDVAKDGNDKENRFNLTPVSLSVTSAGTSGHPTSTTTNITSGVALLPHSLASSSDQAVHGTIFLTPIKEQDSGSVHNTLQAGSPTTAALANAILPQLQANTDWQTGKTYIIQIPTDQQIIGKLFNLQHSVRRKLHCLPRQSIR